MLLVPAFLKNTSSWWILAAEITVGIVLLVLDLYSNWWFNNFLILLLVVRGTS